MTERTIVVAVLASLLAIGGCGSSSPAATDKGGGDVGRTAASLQDAIDDQVNLFNENEADLAACLEAAGYSYSPRRAEVAITTSDGLLLSRTESMRKFGYGIVNGDGSKGIEVSVFGGDVPPEEVSAVQTATAEGGACFGDVNDFDVQEAIQDAGDEFASFPPELAMDEELQASFRAWSACMNESGYQFATFADAFSSIEERAQSIDLNDVEARRLLAEDEVSVATADANCFDTRVRPVAEALLEESGA